MKNEPVQPDFSTSFWKEFKLRYPRPAVYVPVGVAYTAFLYATITNPADMTEVSVILVAIAMLAMSTVPAAVASRRFGGLRERMELRSRLEGVPTARHKLIRRRWCLAQLLQAVIAPGLGLLLLLPLYLYGVAMSLDGVLVGALFGLTLWVQAAVALLLTALVGARSTMEPRVPRYGWAVWSAAMTVLLRAVPVGAVWMVLHEVVYQSDILWTMYWLTCLLDLAVCGCGAAIVLYGLPWALQRRLMRPEEAAKSDAAVLAEAPEGMGLGITFWALFRWKFWRDPCCRAERRHLWSTWKVLLLHVLNVAGCLGGNVGGLYVARMFMSERALLGIIAVAARMPVMIAPAIMIIGISNDREGGTLEGLLLTPIAPLRLVASKLAGRTMALVRAGLVSSVILALLMGMLFMARPGGGLMLFITSCYVVILWVAFVPLYACIGTLVGMRVRSVLGALSVAYLAVAGIEWLVWYRVSIFLRNSTVWYGGGSGYESVLRLLLEGPLPMLLCVAVLIRILLPWAARQLVLRGAR